MKTLESFLSELRQRDVTLWLDDNRLRYRAPEGCLLPHDLAELRDRKAEVITFLKAAKQLSSTHQPLLHPVPREGNLPLSFAQQRFWFLYQFEPDSPANNMPVVVRFTGNLHLEVLKRSIAEVVRRHEVLRSHFSVVDGQPVLAIAPMLEVELAMIDLQGIPDEQRDAETQQLATKDARQPFDLEAGPLLRVTLFRLTEQAHLLLWTMPCIICDGTSSDLFYRELTTCYVAYATGKSPELPDLPIQYADFAHWQRQYLQGEILESHLKYWKQQLSDTLTPLRLPASYPRPAGFRTCRGDRYARMLPKSLHQELVNLSQQLGSTLFVILLTAFTVLLHRYSQQDDILTTFVSSGRNRMETENLIGFFSNTLILRTHLDRELSFRDLVQRIHQQNLDAYAHQELPFERLIDALSPEQRQGRSPLFQTKFTLNPPWTNGQGMTSITLPDLLIESLFGYIYHGKTKYDLILVTREQDQGLGAVIDYNADLFAEPVMERMMGHFQTILEQVVISPDQAISTIPILPNAEQQCLLEWSLTGKDCSAILDPLVFSESLKDTSDLSIEHLSTNAQTYVLDNNLQLVPIGVAGGLYLAGGKFNQDHCNQANLNSSHLIPNPFSNNSTEWLYKTGKMVCYLSDGSLELANISDRPATVERKSIDVSTSPTPYRDDIEQKLTEIWQRVLGVEAIGIQEDFFDLGGHSLLAVRLFAQIEEVFNQRLPLSTLLKASSIEQLAIVLRHQELSDAWSPLVEIQVGGTKPPLFCIHGGGFNVLVYRALAINLGPDQPVYGLQARGLDGNLPLVSSVEEMAADYIQEIQRIQPVGPYFLAGLSNGGNLALEMAQQLLAQGQEIGLLGMFDSYGPDGIKLLPSLPRLLSSLHYVVQHSLPRSVMKCLGANPMTLLTKLQTMIQLSSQGNTSIQDQITKYSSASPKHLNEKSHVSIANKLEYSMDRLSNYILDRSPWHFFNVLNQLETMDNPVSNKLKELEATYRKIYRAYLHRSYPGKITLFQAKEFPPGYYLKPLLGWKEIAQQGVELYKIPGHHTSIMESTILGEKMRACIGKAINN